MKKWIKPVVLIAVFFVTVIVASVLMNKTTKDLTASMKSATLPVVSFLYDDFVINELHGYTQEMDVATMRGSITPFKEDRLLHVNVLTYGTAVDAIEYEIRSLDGSRLVASGEISDYKQSGDHIRFDAGIERLLEVNQEYMYRLCLTASDKKIYYYTRIQLAKDRDVPETLAFAEKFHEYTLNGEGASFIPTYMDAATGDTSTLNYVDLTCTLRQITWADFKGDILTDPVAYIKEINDTYNVILISYVMSSVNGNGETEYYNIEEYYRLRNSDSRMYVLNFERTMSQIFRGENIILSDQADLQLGIRNTDVAYKQNEAGTIIAFEQEGELWCYNSLENKIARVFSFRSVEGIDSRENWGEHELKIISVDEAGSVDFIVYGYMNRGPHEGEVGVAVYHYDGIAHTLEEEVFIPSAKSYQVLKSDLGQILYVNDRNQLFLIVSGSMYQIDLGEKSAKKILSNLTQKCYRASESGRYFSWVETSQMDSASSITLMDLDGMQTHEIKGEEGTYLRPLGFIKEDFIYGVADPEALVTDASGRVHVGMKELKILESEEDGTLTELKSYSPASGFITGIDVKDYMITVELSSLTEGRFVPAESDVIMNRSADAEENVLVTTTVTDIKQRQVQIELKNTKSKDAKMITSKMLISEMDSRLELETEDKSECYYVYARGDVSLMTESLADAIEQAYRDTGVVVNQNQQYVWNRAREVYVNPFTGMGANEQDKGRSALAVCVSAMLRREGVEMSVADAVDSGDPLDVLRENLQSDLVLDVSGCTLEQVLFYVSEGNPVLAMTNSSSPILLIGYTASQVYYFNPQTGSTGSMGMESAVDLFSVTDTRFLTYLKK